MRARDRRTLPRLNGGLRYRSASQGVQSRGLGLWRALERTLHGMFRLKRKQVAGAGAEWFIAPRDKVVAAYEKAVG